MASSAMDEAVGMTTMRASRPPDRLTNRLRTTVRRRLSSAPPITSRVRRTCPPAVGSPGSVTEAMCMDMGCTLLRGPGNKEDPAPGAPGASPLDHRALADDHQPTVGDGEAAGPVLVVVYPDADARGDLDALVDDGSVDLAAATDLHPVEKHRCRHVAERVDAHPGREHRVGHGRAGDDHAG